MATVYSDILLEHYKHPRNFGSLPQSTSSASVDNPLCGDKITIEVATKAGKITDIAFSGEGCVISQAAASLLTQHAKGKKSLELLKLDTKKMKKLVGIEVSPSRLKCLLLSLEGLKKVLIQH